MPDTKTSLEKPKSITDRVTADLLKKIISGHWEAGQKLPAERSLAEELGISRVSLRAALQRLKAQGFLESVQGGGNRVLSRVGTTDPALLALVQVDQSSLSDLMDIRIMLEGWAVKRAVSNATEEDHAKLRSLLEKMKQDDEDKAELDMAFHMTIAHAAGSVVYLHLLELIRATVAELIHYHRYQLFELAGVADMTLSQHEAIAHAIFERDEVLAQKAMHHHLEWVRVCYGKAGLLSPE